MSAESPQFWNNVDQGLLDVLSHDVLAWYKNNYLSSDSIPDTIDSRDLERLSKDAHFLNKIITQYLITLGTNKQPIIKDIIDKIDQTLQFRKEYKINDLTPAWISDDVLRTGMCYTSGQDINGNPVVYVQMNRYKRDPEFIRTFKIFVCFILEQHTLLYQQQLLAILVDCTGVGMAHIDFDIARFLLSLFFKHYPLRLSCILLYNIPWVLMSSWAVCRRWLPSYAAHSTFVVQANEIINYIPPDQLLSSYPGGLNNWRYSYPISLGNQSTPLSQFLNIILQSDNDTIDDESKYEEAICDTHAFEVSNRHRDEYFENNSSYLEALSSNHELMEDNISGDVTENADVSSSVFNSVVPNCIQSQASAASRPLSGNFSKTLPCLFLSPNDCWLVFTYDNSTRSYYSILSILNNHPDMCVAFKVKSTSVKNYIASPILGLLPPVHSIDIKITLTTNSILTTDRFLIMAAVYKEQHDSRTITDIPKESVIQFWKDINNKDIVKYFYKCRQDIEESFKVTHQTQNAKINYDSSKLSSDSNLEQNNTTHKRAILKHYYGLIPDNSTDTDTRDISLRNASHNFNKLLKPNAVLNSLKKADKQERYLIYIIIVISVLIVFNMLSYLVK